MKKIEVCVPIEFREPLQVELAAAGIFTGVFLPCDSFQTHWLPDFKEARRSKMVRCKIELIVSDRLVSRATEIVFALLEARKLISSVNVVIVTDVEASYQFDAGAGSKAKQKPSTGVRI